MKPLNNNEQIQELEKDEEYSREEYSLLYSLKNILDFYFGEISLETILTLSAV